MNASSTQALIMTTLTDFGTSAGVILASIIGLSVGLLVAYWGWRTLTHSVGIDTLSLEYMHSAEGTKRFKTLGPKDQESWAKRDRDLSRARILAMDK